MRLASRSFTKPSKISDKFLLSSGKKIEAVVSRVPNNNGRKK
jgi:hypothetical protein